MVTLYFIILASWILFLIVLAFTAPAIYKTSERIKDPRNMGYIISAVLVVLLYFRGSIFGSSAKYLVFVNGHIAVALFGTALVLAGVALAVWARWHHKKMAVQGVDATVIRSGPYAYVRFPMYAGVLVAMAGSAIVGGLPWLLIAAAVATYIVWRTRLEEKAYVQAFPKLYPVYQKQTKMLVPFVV